MAPIVEMIGRCKATDEFLAYANYPAPTPVYKLIFVYEWLINHYIAQKRVNSIYYPWNAQNILSLSYHPTIKAYLEEIIPLVERIDARGQWSDSEKSWLRERYAAVRLNWSVKERQSSDPDDFDLPSRYPDMGLSQVTGRSFS